MVSSQTPSPLFFMLTVLAFFNRFHPSPCDEELRVAIFARSDGGKSDLAALFAEQALGQSLQTLVIEPLREYDIRNDEMSCELLRDLPLGSVNPGAMALTPT
jgi:hypothetical protein